MTKVRTKKSRKRLRRGSTRPEGADWRNNAEERKRMTEAKQAVLKGIGANVRRLRMERGLSLKQVADRVPFTAPGIMNLERGTCDPGLFRLCCIVKALANPTEVLAPFRRALRDTPTERLDAHATRSLREVRRGPRSSLVDNYRVLGTLIKLAKKYGPRRRSWELQEEFLRIGTALEEWPKKEGQNASREAKVHCRAMAERAYVAGLIGTSGREVSTEATVTKRLLVRLALLQAKRGQFLLGGLLCDHPLLGLLDDKELSEQVKALKAAVPPVPVRQLGTGHP